MPVSAGPGLRFGIDVGGTFTDVVAYDEAAERLTSLKLPTVPDRPEQGVLGGIDRLRDAKRRAEVVSVVHGTTVVTNAILEGRGASVALVTTRGFRDVLEIGRQARESLYQLDRPGRPPPLVPRQRRFEVDERVAFDGSVLRPLDPADLAAVVEAVRASAAQAVAVCCLHAYANPAHEQAVKAALSAAVPFVCASSEINAEFREFERTSTTVLNALVMPIVERYLDGLSGELAARGVAAPLHVVQSSGGMMSAGLARRLPVRMVMSGPAAGVAAAEFLARQLEIPNAVTFDMGGTSTDVCLIGGGQLETARERQVDGRPLRMPSVAVESIGAGGGSVAWLDPTGALKVGPKSAGAQPGPAAYGRGGEEPTVTDANVVLGYIRPGVSFGGTITIERGPAETALARIAEPLGLGLLEAAHGILEIADESMARALRLVSVQQGYDLRAFALIAYGGAGPLHAGRLARRLGIPRVVIPAQSSVFSALGCLVSDLRYDAVQTHHRTLSDLDPRELEQRFRRLEAEVAAPLLAEGYRTEQIRFRRSMDLRYSGQNYELEVAVGSGDELGGTFIRAHFNQQHRERYTYMSDEEVECVNLRAVAAVPSALSRLPERPPAATGRPIAEQECHFAETGRVSVPVYRRADLGAEPVVGPAIVEDEQSTILISTGQHASADRFGNLHLEASGQWPVVSDQTSGQWPVVSGQQTTASLTTNHWPLTTAVDPVTLEVVRSGIYAITEEMRVIVMRSARSPLLKEAGDLSCVLTDAAGRLIAQGSKDNLMHLGTMGFTVKELLKRVSLETIRDGDVFFTNLPAVGGNHLPDVKALRPIFYRGRLVAWAVNLSHWPDVGGALPGSYVTWATEIYQEGLQISPIRLFDRDGPIAENLELVLANLRGRVERRGDIFAQAACANVAAERLVELFERYGLETVLACFERFLDESELLMRAALREVPDGEYAGEDCLDDDGLASGPIRLAVRVTIDGDRAVFDWSDTDPQVPGPLNTTSFITCSAVYYVCKALFGPDIPANEGCYRPLAVIVPPGKLLNASADAAVVGGNHETSQRAADALFKAFAPVLPERVVAGGITSAGLAILTGRWPDGRRFVLYETHGGGSGAGARHDGANAVRVHLSNVMNTPTEVIEAEYPLLVERHELREGSGGAGRQRGGLGLRRAYRILNPQARLTTMIERCSIPPWGLFGGSPGALSRVSLVRDGRATSVSGKETRELVRDDVVVMESAGGGGYGQPAERSTELVERDRRGGYA